MTRLLSIVLALAALGRAAISPEILAQLRSPDWRVRSGAFYSNLKGNVDFTSDEKSALVALAVREERDSSTGLGEGYAEYLSWLADALTKIADAEPARQDVWPPY